jgi:hypothetical protein
MVWSSICFWKFQSFKTGFNRTRVTIYTCRRKIPCTYIDSLDYRYDDFPINFQKVKLLVNDLIQHDLNYITSSLYKFVINTVEFKAVYKQRSQTDRFPRQQWTLNSGGIVKSVLCTRSLPRDYKEDNWCKNSQFEGSLHSKRIWAWTQRNSHC